MTAGVPVMLALLASSWDFPAMVPQPTALPALVEELEEYFWITSTATGENHDLLTVTTMGLVSTTVTILPMLV